MFIAKRIAIFILLFSAVFTLLGTAVQLHLNYQADLEALDATFVIIEKSHISSLKKDIWDLDLDAMETELSEIMNLPDVAYLELVIPNMSTVEKGIRPPQERQLIRQYNLSFSNKSSANTEKMPLGSLTIVLTLENMYQRLTGMLSFILVTEAIKILFVSAFIIFLFYMYVTRHLHKIKLYLETTRLDTLSKPLQLTSKYALFGLKDKRNELKVLVDSINTMREEMINSIEIKRSSELQIKYEQQERIEVENALQVSELQRVLILKAMPDLVWLKDPDGVYLNCNSKFERLYGAKISEIVGKTDYDFVDKELADYFREKDKLAIDAGRPSLNEEEVSYADDGHKELLETIKTPIFSPDGTLIGVLGVGRDITARRQTEEELRRAQKMDAIGKLTGGIAHDFNNLLAIMIGNLELLHGQMKTDDKAINRIESIEKAAERAAILIKQLLDFSRRQAVQMVVTDLNDVIKGMDDLITRSLTPEVKVEYNFTNNLWQTEIDPGDFQNVLINLCINARDAMSGHGLLTIETHNSTLGEDYCEQNPGVTPGEYVELAVNDDGEGIPLELQERIFEPFFTTKEQGKGKGTGLGLALAFGFVNRSSGYIKCYSEQGMGTTFRLYLPRVKRKAEAIEQNDEQLGSLPGGHDTILIVDDEADLLDLAREILETLGYRVFTANDGQQALQKLAEEPSIELLFSDVVMPGGINGYELAEQARAMRAELKVLLTSGYTDKAVSDNAHMSFKANLIEKPYKQIELAMRLREILDQD